MTTSAPEFWVTTEAGPARRRWRLYVDSGADEGQGTELTTSPSLVGASSSSVLALTDDTVSRYHAELDLTAAGLRIRDLRSTNGTFLAEREGPVTEGFLWPNSRFRIGETWLRVEAFDEPQSPLDEQRVTLGGLVGRSEVMQAVFRAAHQLAAGSGPVLLVGPFGSGRAAVARQIHRLSPRADRPLWTVDADDDPGGQLFGRDDQSILRRADEGTLLLRNVDRSPRIVQANLREALERGTIRAGDSRRIDVRLFATCASLRSVEPSLRRHLSVGTIEVPPLEDRVEEVVPLAEHFLQGAGWKKIRLGPRTRQKLAEVNWPDQVAGLSRLVQRLPLAPDTADEALPGLPEVRGAFLVDVMAHYQGDVSSASKDLSVPTEQLFRTLHRYDVDID